MTRARLRQLGVSTLATVSAVICLTVGGSAAAAAGAGASASTGGGPLNVRTAPAVSGARVGTVRNGAGLTIACQVTGQRIVGWVRTTTAWDRLSDGHYVSDAYVRRDATPPPCPAARPAPPSSWVRPVDAPIWGGFRTPQRPTHDGDDLGALRNTPIRAAAAGTVVTAECDAAPTHNCDVDGSPAIAGCGWYVEIRHPDGSVTRYCHLIRRPSVTIGQAVALGQVLGFVGTSGNSSAPHLHFEVHTGYPATRQNAVDPVPFMSAHGAGLGQP
jgi:Peptidase family M23